LIKVKIFICERMEGYVCILIKFCKGLDEKREDYCMKRDKEGMQEDNRER